MLDLKPGLIQVEGHANKSKSTHDPKTGWRLNFPVPPVKIYIQDDLTFIDSKVIEFENYIKHYGASIDHVTFYVWHRNLNNLYPNLNFVYYPRFQCEQHMAMKLLGADELFEFNDNKQFHFLCLNMNERSHRNTTLQLLQHMPSRLISYKARNWNIAQHPDDWTLEQYNQGRGTESNAENLIQLRNVYNLCQFSVVTETRYNLPYDFITEKTTQCFVTLHPALYVSNKYHVASMRDYGFDMFDDIFDHSYDNLNDDKRLNYMIDSNKDVLTNGIKNYDKLENRLKANRNHYFNEQNNMYKMQKR